ncbi:MAG: polysulfide reductase, NrfD [Rhodospirillaceae bacterium]|nr:polysulfide reductase, NrfD [Rhodospirillaceae bacterium]MBL6929990.1 polysulfide reductase, NrfD [Rhodospirillales bacterium]MBL6942456.1 polysulfide reductase, NrfD [Rhodospirillales bacterium]
MEDFGSWSIITTNFLIVLYLALGGIILSSLLHLVNAKWRFQVRWLACANMALFPVAFVLLLILLSNGEATFPWLASAHNEDVHLPGWQNYTFLVIREIGGFIITFGFCYAFVKLQKQADIDPTPVVQRRFRNVALTIPFVYVIYGSMIAWDFEMTMEAGWHSASYAAYQFQSNFHGFLAYFVLMLYVMDKTGHMKDDFERKIYNYLAQLILGMTILWIYFYFTQYLVFWYGRLPFEMDRFNRMFEGGYFPLIALFLTFKFIIPFCTFIFTPARHSRPTVAIVAIFILAGTWLERYVWISGSVSSRYFHTPLSSSFDLLVTGLIMVAVFMSLRWRLNRDNLLKNRHAV